MDAYALNQSFLHPLFHCKHKRRLIMIIEARYWSTYSTSTCITCYCCLLARVYLQFFLSMYNQKQRTCTCTCTTEIFWTVNTPPPPDCLTFFKKFSQKEDKVCFIINAIVKFGGCSEIKSESRDSSATVWLSCTAVAISM